MSGGTTVVICTSVACVTAAAITPFARRLALSSSFFDRPGAHKSHETPVPYLGGLAIAIAVLAGLTTATVIGFSQYPSLAVIVLAATSLVVLGGLDDKVGLRADVRLLVQGGAATAAVLAGTRLTITGSGPVDALVTIAWIVAITNALNFVDNMDGLAAGLTAVGAICIAIIAGSASPAIAVMSGALAGACLGFLVWNRPPARIYMGDAGSLFVGFLLAVLSANAADSLAVPRSLAVPVLVLALPLLDIVTVTMGRIRRGIPITIGGRNHLSHRLVARGWRRGHAVLALVALSAVPGALAVAVAENEISTFTAVSAAAVLLLAITAVTARVEVFGHDGRPRLPRVVLLAFGGAAVVALALAPAVLSVLEVRHDVAAASNLTREALAAHERGDDDLAASKFSQAVTAAAKVRRRLSGPLVSVGLVVPVVRDNVLASREVADVVTDLATASVRGNVDSKELRSSAADRLSHSEDRILLRSVSGAAASLRASVPTTIAPVKRAAPPSPRHGVTLPLTLLAAAALVAGGFGLMVRHGRAETRAADPVDDDVDLRRRVLYPPPDLLLDTEAGRSRS